MESSRTCTATFNPPLAATLFLRSSRLVEDRVDSEATDVFSHQSSCQGVGSLTSSVASRELSLIPAEESWTVTGAAWSIIAAPFQLTYDSGSYLLSLLSSPRVTYVLKLMTARGVIGTVNCMMGALDGALWGIMMADTIGKSLIDRTVAVACSYKGVDPFYQRLLKEGAYNVIKPGLKIFIVGSSVVAGGFLFVIIGNVLYELSRSEHRELIREWLRERETDLEEALVVEPPKESALDRID